MASFSQAQPAWLPRAPLSLAPPQPAARPGPGHPRLRSGRRSFVQHHPLHCTAWPPVLQPSTPQPSHTYARTLPPPALHLPAPSPSQHLRAVQHAAPSAPPTPLPHPLHICTSASPLPTAPLVIPTHLIVPVPTCFSSSLRKQSDKTVLCPLSHLPPAPPFPHACSPPRTHIHIHPPTAHCYSRDAYATTKCPSMPPTLELPCPLPSLPTLSVLSRLVHLAPPSPLIDLPGAHLGSPAPRLIDGLGFPIPPSDLFPRVRRETSPLFQIHISRVSPDQPLPPASHVPMRSAAWLAAHSSLSIILPTSPSSLASPQRARVCDLCSPPSVCAPPPRRQHRSTAPPIQAPHCTAGVSQRGGACPAFSPPCTPHTRSMHSNLAVCVCRAPLYF